MSNTEEEVPVNGPINNTNTTQVGTLSPKEQLDKIEETLKQLKIEILFYCQENKSQIAKLTGLCFFLALLGWGFCYTLYNSHDYEDYWTWQMIYFTVARIIAVSAFFYLVSYCFKLLKSYIFIYQRNRHRLFVINSLSNLIAAANAAGGIDMKFVFDKILDIIVRFDDANIVDEKDGNVSNPMIEKLMDAVLKKADKD